MHFPKFWYLAQNDNVSAWGWSDFSEFDAKQRAESRAADLSTRPLIRGQHRWYPYPDKPLREQVLEELEADSNKPAAVVTRNGYGVLVLNTGYAAFLDIDLNSTRNPQTGESMDRPSPAPSAWWGFLMPGRRKEGTDEVRAKTLSKIREWCARNRSWSGKLYETFGGYRLLVTHRPIEPDSREIVTAAKELDVDPRYMRLCLAQNSFRARLSPKPWRCGVSVPPSRWPWISDAEKQQFERWRRHYDQSAEKFATCRLITSFGNNKVHPDIEPILALHDDRTLGRADQPLA